MKKIRFKKVKKRKEKIKKRNKNIILLYLKKVNC